MKSFIKFAKDYVEDCPDCYEGLNEFFFGNKKKQEPEKKKSARLRSLDNKGSSSSGGFRYLDVDSNMSDYEQCWKKAYNVMLKNNMDGEQEPIGAKDIEEKAKKKCEKKKERTYDEPSGDIRTASQGNYDPRLDGGNWSGGKPGAGKYAF